MGVAAFEEARHLELAIHNQGNKKDLHLNLVEVEELILKRCWLARYWGLAAKLGVYPHDAHKKHSAWAKFSLPPLEIVVSAGHKAKLDLANHTRSLSSSRNCKKCTHDGIEGPASRPAFGTSTAGGNVGEVRATEEEESLRKWLSAVDDALREMADLRVEEAVLITISQKQNPTLTWLGLSKEEARDIQFKQAWLVYSWWRAHLSEVVEQDVALDRLLYWIDRSNRPPSYQDAIDVERGMSEARSSGVAWPLRKATNLATSNPQQLA